MTNFEVSGQKLLLRLVISSGGINDIQTRIIQSVAVPILIHLVTA
jgi:hypothetical protein